MLDQLTHEMFAEHLNETFVLREESVTMNLELIEVTKLGARGQNRDSFSLLFQAPKDSQPMPQKKYSLEHKTMGTLTLFIVPIGPGWYEAVFT